MNENPDYWIEKLRMTAHPEGGYYSEVYRSNELITGLPGRYSGQRCFSTSIFFLLKNEEFSAIHRIRSDEIWHYYVGTSGVGIYMLEHSGKKNVRILGQEIGVGEELQVVINAGNWFGAKQIKQGSFALMGCTVAPGFEFKDFELGKRDELIKTFPQHQALIEMLTHT